MIIVPTSGALDDKIRQQLLPVLGQYRFRMKLYAGHRKTSMPQSHDDTVIRPGSHFQAVRQTVGRHNQRVIAGGCERILEPGENRSSIVKYLAGLAMHDGRSLDDLPSESRANSLVAQAHSQNRDLSGQTPYGLHHYT